MEVDGVSKHKSASSTGGYASTEVRKAEEDARDACSDAQSDVSGDSELFHLYRQVKTASPGVRVNDESWQKRFDEASGDFVPTIAMVGDTRSGKSFLVNRLRLREEPGPQEANDEGNLGSTTCDVHLFLTEAFKPLIGSKVQILDFEGENGGGVTQQLQRGLGRMAALFNRPTDANDRRVLVQRYFPRMAFLLGDIVCLVGTEDFTNHRYFRRCQQFALTAIQLMSDVRNPYLLLLQNKVSPREYRACKKRDLTADFLEAHKESGAEELLLQFQGVRCLKIPMLEEMLIENPKYELDPENEPEHILVKSEKVFQDAIGTIRETVVNWCMELRRARDGMSQALWFQLARFIVDAITLEQPISIASVCGSLTSVDDSKVAQVAKYFNVLYQNVSQRACNRFEQYLFARRQAMDLASRIFCCQVLGHGGARVFQTNRLPEKFHEEKFHEYYEKVANELDKYQPCMAVHPVWCVAGKAGKADKDKEFVHCYQSKETHTGHRAWESVEPQTMFQCVEAFLQQVLRTYSSEYVQQTFNPSWSGRFEGAGVDRAAESERVHASLERMLKLSLDKDMEGMINDALASMKDVAATFGHDRVRSLCMPHAVLGSCMMCASEYPGKSLRAIPRPLRQKLFAVCTECMQTLEGLGQQDENELWEDKCCVCASAQANVLLLPCGHVNMCKECAEALPRPQASKLGSKGICPQDRQIIQEFEFLCPG